MPSPTSGSPRFASALTAERLSSRVLRAVLDELEAGLEGATPDLVLAFATHHHGPELEGLGQGLARATGASLVAGCTAESVIGPARELEGTPGLALWAAHLPGTQVRATEVTAHADGQGTHSLSTLPPIGAPEHTSLLVLADPYSFPVDALLTGLNEKHPGVPAMGGMASGAMGPGQTMFFSESGLRESGCLVISLEGAIEILPVVSQGCRPVGKPWVITECDRNVIKKLGGRPALEVLIETLNGLARSSEARPSMPFIGLAIDPTRTRFERGDFLARGIMAMNQRDRSIAVADFVRRGQTVQLLVRDAESAGEDLRSLIAGNERLHEDCAAGEMGALLFSCNGRGKRMFGKADHDVGCVQDALPVPAPVAGFFAAGEIGPVGGRNFLHGFTASIAFFRARA